MNAPLEFPAWPRYEMPLPPDVVDALEKRERPLKTEEEMLRELGELEERSRKQYKIEDFVYNMKDDRFYNIETLGSCSEKGVNSAIPKSQWESEIVPGRDGTTRQVLIKPSASIARIESGNVVEGVVWWPGKPRIIHDVFVNDDGVEMHAPRRRALNLFVPAQHQETRGDPAKAGLWIEHLQKLWPEDADLLLDYFAHTVQRPQEKINFALVLNGNSGIGKDMALLPVKFAIGGHNAKDVTPDNITSGFNGWAKCVLLVVNEARPSDSDFKATDFYERLKPMIAAPPDWLVRNGKYEKQEHVRNIMRVVITTNDSLALFVSEDDRRLYFAESKLPKGWASRDYFSRLSSFYKSGGYGHVYAYLLQRDVSKFDPKWVPAPNAAHKVVSASWNQPIHDPIVEVLDELAWPPVFFGSEILRCEVAAFDNKEEVRLLLRSSRKMAMRMNKLGYEQRSSPYKSNGWKFSESSNVFRSRVAFVKKDFAGDFDAEIERRGREIAANGRAARPKVVPLNGVES